PRRDEGRQMIVVDSSVWIDYFNGKKTRQTDWLDSALGSIPVIMGDLILTEVLQGFQNNKEFRVAKDLLLSMPFMPMVGQAIALKSAENYRSLRRKGVTVRKTIDVIIGTFCIYYQLPLLHDDRDFDPMVKFLGLKIVGT
ncbi:MAG: vapC 2, partial [Deltaproteobacteria bacterium]|nr:vapC 2 [Deltaproteobacteria bacterium]